MSCPVCGHTDTSTKLHKDGIEILACKGCGLAWWCPPASFAPEATYDAGYFEDSGVARGYDDYATLGDSLRRSFAARLAQLPAPAAGARLLDVGAAYGYAVAEARARGFDAHGIEISRSAARRAARETGGRVAVASASPLPFAAGSFDVVTLWDVLEHLPDPVAVTRELAQVLRPGGRLLLTTGDVGSLVARLSGPRWHLYTLPEHLFFFSRESLRILLDRAGLRVESMTTEASFYTAGYLVERLRKTLLGREGRGPARWPGARLRVPVNLFDIVKVTAIKA